MGSPGISGPGRLHCGALDAIPKQLQQVRLNFLPGNRLAAVGSVVRLESSQDEALYERC